MSEEIDNYIIIGCEFERLIYKAEVPIEMNLNMRTEILVQMNNQLFLHSLIQNSGVW